MRKQVFVLCEVLAITLVHNLGWVRRVRCLVRDFLLSNVLGNTHTIVQVVRKVRHSQMLLFNLLFFLLGLAALSF